MRKILLVLSLAGLTALASASDVFARGRSNSGRGNSASAGRSNVARSGYNNGGRGGYGYGNSGYGGYGYGGGYLPFGGAFLPYGSLGYGPYSQGYGYGYAPGYYSDPAYSAPATQFRQSYYPATAPLPVTVTVLVPVADAQVWFQNIAMTEPGMERLFASPPLEPNQNFTYTIKARWMQNGQPVTQERQVQVQAGQNVTINFRDNVPMPTVPITTPQN